MAQRLPNSAIYDFRNRHLVAGRSLEHKHCAEPEKCCAYNQTRGRLLGSEVDVADFSVASLNDRTQTLTADSGAGLWLVPFRGIPLISEHSPLDLIYLDASFVVIDAVESFPTFSISKASPPAASVLALPRCTIYLTQTRRGDQLLFCDEAELNRHPLQLPSSSGDAETALTSDSGIVPPTCGGSGSQVQSDDSSGQELLDADAPSANPSPSQKSHGDVWNDLKKQDTSLTKNWLQRWWSPDPPEPRKAPRESLPGLGAHFWTGGISVEHGVRDISLTGLYVITDERWFLGTQVRMTLTDSGESTVRHSITANTSVVRWGNDGVGLKFVMENHNGSRRGQTPQVGGLDERELNGFLQLARSGKRYSETRDTAFRSCIAQSGAIHDTEQRSLPFTTGVQPAGNGQGSNSSLIGATANQVLMNISGQAVNGIEARPMDGIEVLRPRNAPSPLSSISAHLMVSPLEREDAVSGHADPDFDNLFIGPIDSSLLIGSLKDLPRPVSVAGAVPSTPSRRRPRILLIDDEYLEVAFLAGTLEDDYEIIFATDGVTALETAGRDMPDLILLDVKMPGIDGFEVCRRLKADVRTKEIPVIFITGLNEVAAETKGLKMGAVDYINKPFHPGPLRVRVNMHIKLQSEWAN